MATTFNYKEFDVKVFILLMVVSFLFYYPVVYGSGFYADDVFRVNASSHGFGWHSLGRFFATAIALIYSNNTGLIVDATPLTWMLSIVMVGICAKLIYCKLNKDYKEFALPLSMVFLINPFLLENLLYRFDNFGMFLGLFFSILAFSLNQNKFSFAIKASLLLISLNFYQTFSNIFISLVAIELSLRAYKNVGSQKIKDYFLISIAVFMLANIVYYVELNLIGIPSRGEMLPFELNSFVLIIKNYLDAFGRFVVFWSYSKWYVYFIFSLIIFSLIISKADFKTYVTLLISSVLIFLSTLGAMALLKYPPLFPRTLHYFSPVMMFVTLVLIIGDSRLKWFMVVPVFVCFVFSYRVGNMQKLQSDFEKPIAYSLTADLLADKSIKKYYSIGNMPYSKYIKNVRSNTPFYGFMYREQWITVGILNEYAPKGLVVFEWSAEARKTHDRFNIEKPSMVLTVDKSPFYKIYKNNHEGWIVWQ